MTDRTMIDPVQKPAPEPLSVDQQQITEALAELRGARLDYEHSPNANTELTVEYAELRLNRLLDRYCPCGADDVAKPKALA